MYHYHIKYKVDIRYTIYECLQYLPEAKVDECLLVDGVVRDDLGALVHPDGEHLEDLLEPLLLRGAGDWLRGPQPLQPHQKCRFS